MTEPKKRLILATLEVLKKHTDEEHPLKQVRIQELISEEFGLSIDRKSLRRNLSELQEAGYPVEGGTSWYYIHEFHSSELNLIADSLMYNPAVPWKQCHEILEKLRGLASKYYEPTRGESLTRPANSEFLVTLDALHEAIGKRKKVCFRYCQYDVDKKLHPKLRKDGSIRLLTVSPYRVVQSAGRYYLIGNTDGHDGITHYRLDRIRELRITKSVIRGLRDVEGGTSLYNMPRYLTEHPHMFSGPVITAKLQASRRMAGDILDWFGMETQFQNVTDESLEAIVRVDERSLGYWLKQYDEEVVRME
ncbi:MAG: WYL domain-containing protein [Clostridiales bacterium]|nr:WYL domain-containing protein [Clostridiales bacterium]